MKLARIALLAIVLPVAPAGAAFHLWTIAEVFSNADGSVQFVELVSSGSGEFFISGQDLNTLDDDVVLETFRIPNHLSSPPNSTLDRRFLVATPGFAALPGAVVPDYTLPAPSFIELGVADTVAWPGSGDEFPLVGLPTDGVLSLGVGGATAVNSPTNFSGAVGSLDLPEPGATLLGVGALASLGWLARRTRQRISIAALGSRFVQTSGSWPK